MFRIQMLPAEQGDCLWVEYGETTPPRRLLIDGGTSGTWKALQKKIAAVTANDGAPPRFELFVVTHVDADHIAGSLKLLESVGELGVTFGDVWFNGYYHLDNKQPPSTDVLGPKQGEMLSTLIAHWKLTWNGAFQGRAVMVPDTGALPVITVAGMRITLLSPTFAALQALKPKWEQEVINAGLTPGDAYEVEAPPAIGGDALGDDIQALADRRFKKDTAEANGSSIAFLAEHEGKSAVFAADAHPDVLLAGVARLPADQRSRRLNAFKVPHHGSRNNVSRDLVKALPATHYLISTNGKQNEHPHPEAIARIVCESGAKVLDFNYRTGFNSDWASASRIADWHYSAHFGSDDDGLIVDL